MLSKGPERRVTRKSRLIRSYLLDGVRASRPNLVEDAASVFGISSQAINRHLSVLVDAGLLVASGKTRSKKYALGPVREKLEAYPLTGLQEDIVHRRDFGYVFEGLPQNISEICHYGFTEMLNNAIDHSEGREVWVSAARDEVQVRITIQDDGEGIFKRIARLLDLPDPRTSLIELSKGKLTTDPAHHSGQGIFFTSRAFESFHIFSGDLVFTHDDARKNDYLMDIDVPENGTLVMMSIAVQSDKDLGVVFSEYTSGEAGDYDFSKTVVPLRMALYEGEALVSRSQAKRILTRADRFRTVILDFAGVDKIGQAFADEMFRVYHRNHPDVELVPIHITEEIDLMIRRVYAESMGDLPGSH
jgi:anti-sigma regulatory factor (Ser/Thr protein kinase)